VRAAVRQFLVVVIVVAGALARPTGASAQASPDTGLGIRLVEVPTASRNDPRANQYIVDGVEPGTVVKRRFEVSNGTQQPLTPRMYVGAATIKDGAFVPSEDAKADLPTWSTVDPGSTSLAPGATATATVTITVPADAAAGERYGAIWAELPAVATGGGVSEVNRVGIRIYLDVRQGSEPPTSFRLDTFTPSLSEDGRPGVDIATCNTGARAIDLAGELDLDDGPGGINAGPFASEGPAVTLSPDQCGTVPIRLDPAIPKGPWKATVTLRSGKVTASASATITFPSTPGSEAAPVKAKPKEVTGTSGGRWALLIALLLLLLVLLLLLWWLWRRRKKEQEEAVPPAAA
jgi:LPXTG-motif cell wall-anchored protein